MDNKSIILALIKALGDKQGNLADELGITQPTISRWLKGAEIKSKHRDALYLLAEEKGIVNHDPYSDRETSDADYENFIPEIDLTAGLGGGGFTTVAITAKNGVTFAKEAVRDHWRLPDWIFARMNARPQNIAAFPVQGDSMEPTLEDGDIVFIDTRHRAPSPDGIYALADEFGGVIVKRLEVISRPGEEDVRVSIISDNPRHRSRELTLPEISIVGRYVGRFTT